MRRQLALMVAATLSLVLIAFMLPLALLVRDVARGRALSAAQQQAEALVPVVATGRELALVVERADQDSHGQVSVFLPDGDVLGSPAAHDDSVRLASTGKSFTTRLPGGRAVLVAVRGQTGTSVIRVFVPEGELTRGVTRAIAALGALAVGLLLVALLVADRLAGEIVRPITSLADVAHQLGTGDLDARVTPSGPPETVAVGTAVNRLAERIRELLAAEREEAADLSHRLRTPLTALRLEAEALSQPDEADRIGAGVDAVESAVSEVIRAARRGREPAISDLVGVALERVAFWRPLAEDQARDVDVQVPDQPRPVHVAADDLAAAIDALLGNVFAHTPDGTAFAVCVEDEPGGVRLAVKDRGPGLDAAAVTRGVSGAGSTGLGLDIVRRTVEGAGGRLELVSAPGAGTTVVLHFTDPGNADGDRRG